MLENLMTNLVAIKTHRVMLDFTFDNQMTSSDAQHCLVLGHIHFVIVGADLLLANGTAGGSTEQFQHVLGLVGCLIDGGAHIHLALLHDNSILVHLELGHGRAKGLVRETTLRH